MPNYTLPDRVDLIALISQLDDLLAGDPSFDDDAEVQA